MQRRVILLSALLFIAQFAFAQYTSGVEGTALDQTGAAVPNAKVLVTNEATQVTKETTTNASGYFRAPAFAFALGRAGSFAFEAPLVDALLAPAALQTVSVIRRVTTYGSMLAFGRRSSM